MKSTFDQLGPKGKALLADLYEHDSYSALKKFLELERLNIATKLVDTPADDAKTISRQQGRAEALKQLHLGLKDNYKNQREAER